MKINIGENSFNVKVVMNPETIAKGMMKKKFDSNFNGMLFMMNNGGHSFWMKNCIISLDIIFIKDNIITSIHHDCPPCYEKNCPSYSGEGNFVLEVLGGTCKKLNINEKDYISF